LVFCGNNVLLAVQYILSQGAPNVFVRGSHIT